MDTSRIPVPSDLPDGSLSGHLPSTFLIVVTETSGIIFASSDLDTGSIELSAMSHMRSDFPMTDPSMAWNLLSMGEVHTSWTDLELTYIINETGDRPTMELITGIHRPKTVRRHPTPFPDWKVTTGPASNSSYLTSF